MRSMGSVIRSQWLGLLLLTLVSACADPAEVTEVEVREDDEDVDAAKQEVIEQLEVRLVELERKVGELRSQAEASEAAENLFTEVEHLEAELKRLQAQLVLAQRSEADWAQLAPQIARALEEVESSYVDLQRLVNETS